MVKRECEVYLEVHRYKTWSFADVYCFIIGGVVLEEGRFHAAFKDLWKTGFGEFHRRLISDADACLVWLQTTHFSARSRPLLADTWYSLSYLYFSPIGTIVAIVVGLLVSLLTGRHQQTCFKWRVRAPA